MLKTKRDNLTVGMVTTEDVHDRNGQLLLTAGTELTETHLRVFKLWGVIDVAVQGDQEDETAGGEGVEKVQGPLWEQTTEEFKNLFRLTDREHPFIQVLFQLCVDRKVHSSTAEDTDVK